LVLWFGTRLVIGGSLTAGELVVYLAYLKRGFKPLQDFAKYTGRLSKAIAAGERIAELLKTQPDIIEAENAVAAPTLRGIIAFENVSFSYDRMNASKEAQLPTLSNLSFQIDAGEHVAIVGPSGIGKSTLLSLILRLREVTSGCIRIDGEDIRSWKIDSLRQQVSVVLQENCIFATSIRDNIAMFYPEATEEQVISAAKTASAHDFILRLPNGYDTQIGERGVDLSQGQLQRLAIARAALRNVPILLLDEPTCNLDSENRAQVVSSLRNVAKGRTTLVVTHDLDLAKQCDKVLYIGQDYQTMYGSHDELIQNCSSYRAIIKAVTGMSDESRAEVESLV
jgi:ATP-binding cassette subfamily B protein